MTDRGQADKGDDQIAIEYLQSQGYTLTPQWCWIKPTKGHKVTPKENEALIYLIQEWDFGDIIN